jgi:hypothetical protein
MRAKTRAKPIDGRALDHIARAFESYIVDPPDTPFQFGYLAALFNLWQELDGAKDDRLFLAVGRFIPGIAATPWK